MKKFKILLISAIAVMVFVLVAFESDYLKFEGALFISLISGSMIFLASVMLDLFDFPKNSKLEAFAVFLRNCFTPKTFSETQKRFAVVHSSDFVEQKTNKSTDIYTIDKLPA